MKFIRKHIRLISAFALLEFLVEILNPVAAWALTSGPNAPEFTSFEPVTTTDMVDPFSGDFTYNIPVVNIPGPDGGGYAMSLSYHSGVSPEEESSWVGYGWSLNPGAINRNKRGYVDEFKDVDVIQYAKTRPNWSVSSVLELGLEVRSVDASKEALSADGLTLTAGAGNDDRSTGNDGGSTPVVRPSLSLSKSVRFNNYRGYTKTTGYGLGLNGMASLNLNTGSEGTSFGFSVSPLGIIDELTRKSDDNQSQPESHADSEKPQEEAAEDQDEQEKAKMKYSLGGEFKKSWMQLENYFGSSMYANYSTPFSVSTYRGLAFNRSGSFQFGILNIGIQSGASANFNVQYTQSQTDMRAYGYMYNPNETEIDNKGRQDYLGGGANYSPVLMDYTVEKSSGINKRDRYLGIPFSQPDQFAASGEGLGGGFRLYKEQMGTFYPNQNRSQQKLRQFGIEFALDPVSASVGIDVGLLGRQFTEVTKWGDPEFSESLDLCSMDDDTFDALIDGVTLADKVDVVTTYMNAQGASNSEIDAATGVLRDWENNHSNQKPALPTLQDYINQRLQPLRDFCGQRFNSDERGFFRFNNDQGGELSYTGSDDAKAANLSGGAFVPGLRTQSYSLSTVGLTALQNRDKARSAYIDYHVFQDVLDGEESFEKSEEIVTHLEDLNDDLHAISEDELSVEVPGAGDEQTFGIEGSISEFAITNKDGGQSVYGLPVFSRKMEEYAVSVDRSEDLVEDNYLAYKEVSMGRHAINNPLFTGSRIERPYAVNHLLTQITNVNFVDVDPNDGAPNEDDFGGWTNFKYRQWENANGDDWYRYRTPYKGLIYDKGQLSDQRDDVGMVSSGLKQVYYLKAIETKTHVAFFVTNKTDFSELASEIPDGVDVPDHVVGLLTGSQRDRKDGLGALLPDADGHDPMALKETDARVGNPNKLEYLERVVLFSKARFDKPISVANFEYSYELQQDLPNSSTGEGKLTLKKIWIDSEGIVRPRIAPYQFSYEYKKNYPSSLLPKYQAIDDHVENISDGMENPDYAPYELDMWGYYQDNGQERHRKQKPWVYQGNERTYFDPGAWNLKSIKLPSGGEIQIQYEQKDYSYVQDRHAMAMVSLRDVPTKTVNFEGSGKTLEAFYLNLEDIGYEGDLHELASKLKSFFISNDNRSPADYVYFKYLYDIQNGGADIDDGFSEYITGYTSVADVGVDGTGLWVALGDNPTWPRKESLRAQNGSTVPIEVCYDFALTNRDGMLEENGKWKNSKYDEVEEAIVNHVINNEQSTMVERPGEFKDDVSIGGVMAEVITADGWDRLPNKDDLCSKLNEELSYLRIPMFKSKKGGGVRVKRLLMYDDGLDTGHEVLYGSEYHYINEDGTSSGVATNEPMAGREENPLVGLLDRQNQSWIGRAISGRDKKQYEGPLGETILPSPSIGHSRVVVHNIHTGKTGTGYQEMKFFTCQDYPFIEKHTEFQNSKDNKKKDWMTLPLGLVNINVRKSWYTQGYSFIVNNMHGQPKSEKSFNGDFGGMDNKNHHLVSSTEYEYYEPGEKLDMLSFNQEDQTFQVDNWVPGGEEDVTMENRKVQDENIDLNLEIDITAQWLMPFNIQLGLMGSFTYGINELYTQVTTKVHNYPAIIKRKTSMVDNVETVTENLMFDKYTGKPVVTAVYDGYHGLNLSQSTTESSGLHDGGIYSYSFPAHWFYEGMGQKALAESNTNQLTSTAGMLTTYGTNYLKEAETWNPYDDQPENVLSASAALFKNSWFDADDESLNGVFNEYGLNGQEDEVLEKLNAIYRAHSNYNYYTSIKNANEAPENRIYNSGMIEDFEFFQWPEQVAESESLNDEKWLRVSEITKYAPHGQPLEELDVLGVPSAARFGYAGKILPTVMAKNAEYESIFFKDFEHLESNEGANNDALVTGESHSGQRSWDLRAAGGYKFLDGSKDNVVLNEHLLREGALVKVWLKSEDGQGNIDPNNAPSLAAKINGGGDNLTAPFTKVASSGEWSLYEVRITDWNGVALGQPITIQLDYSYNGTERVLVDDFRLQPFDAEVQCYVYDVASLRVLTQFGDQHFGVFYQYNNEAQLVRKSIETERGMRTLQESQYNVPRQPRPLP